MLETDELGVLGFSVVSGRGDEFANMQKQSCPRSLYIHILPLAGFVVNLSGEFNKPAVMQWSCSYFVIKCLR